MGVPSRLSLKWFLVFIVTSLLLAGVILVTIGSRIDYQFESYDPSILILVMVPIIFVNFIINFMGFLGWPYMWIFAQLGLVASITLATFVLTDPSVGWAIFVALYIAAFIVGVSLLLGIIFQVIHYFRNRKKEDDIADKMTLNGLKIVGVYSFVLLTSVTYILIYG